jgi:Ni,Fe-hydrogenase I small subunit
MKYYIKKLNDDPYIKSIDYNIPTFRINDKLDENKLDENKLDDDKVEEEYILISHHHKHILSYSDDYVFENKKYYKLDSNEIYFSCIDELEFELEKSIKLQEKAKKLINAGYCIKYGGVNYIYPNKLYQKISNLLGSTKNINLSYLEL